MRAMRSKQIHSPPNLVKLLTLPQVHLFGVTPEDLSTPDNVRALIEHIESALKSPVRMVIAAQRQFVQLVQALFPEKILAWVQQAGSTPRDVTYQKRMAYEWLSHLLEHV